MTTEFTLFNSAFKLIRYPHKHQHKSLQAWDSADEYLIETIVEQSLLPIDGKRPWIIMNDDFGTLGCMFAENQPVWVSDSTIAKLSLIENLKQNRRAAIVTQDCLDVLPENPALVVIKIPRTLALLESQLLQLRKVVTPTTVILAAGKVKAVTRSALELFERTLGPTTTSLAKKKSRLIFCTPSELVLQRSLKSPFPTQWQCELPCQQTVTISNHANVFSRQSLDIGARFMLEHMTVSANDHIVDLGCGNGVLGLNALALSPECNVTFVDESLMALSSAKANVVANFPGKLDQCEFVATNCMEALLTRQPRQRITKVFCNPPFHQQNTITDHIAWQMFHDAHDLLQKGGHLIVVANRHLDYHTKLKRIFGKVKNLSSQKKFVIFSVVKR